MVNGACDFRQNIEWKCANACINYRIIQINRNKLCESIWNTNWWTIVLLWLWQKIHAIWGCIRSASINFNLQCSIKSSLFLSLHLCLRSSSSTTTCHSTFFGPTNKLLIFSFIFLCMISSIQLRLFVTI